MPKRTNKFQKLVYLLKQQLAGQATVTESKELIDRVTLAKVEVDVCIEAGVGGESLTVSIECTKRGRKATVGWVNEMLMKHESLPTNLLVLASASGFVRNAKAKALSRGARLIYLSTVSNATVRGIIGELAKISLSVLEISTSRVRVRLEPIGEHPEIVTTIAPTNRCPVFLVDGTEIGTLEDLCDEFRSSPSVFKEELPADKKLGFTAEWRPLRNGSRLFLKSQFEVLHPLDKILMEGKLEVRRTELKVYNQAIDNTPISWGEGTAPFFDQDVVIVKTTDASGIERISATVGPHLMEPQVIDVTGHPTVPDPT